MRYQISHPYLAFDVNLQALPPQVWGWIGQIIAMGEHIQTIPLPEKDWLDFQLVQLARGALASAKIEGNPSTELEALEIAQGKRKPVKYHEIEIHNLLELYRDATADVFLGFGRFNRAWLCEINRRVLDKVPSLGNKVVPGVVRSHEVGVGKYRAPGHACCSELISRFCDFFGPHRSWRPYEDLHGKPQTAIVKAIIAHLYMALIHPFGDGNGRTSRMIEFMLLFQGSLPAVVGFSLCRHYEETRADYYRVMEDSWRRRPDYTLAPIGFVMYAVKGLLNNLGEDATVLLKLYQSAYWDKVLDEGFPGQAKSVRRQKALAAVIAEAESALSVNQISELLPIPYSYKTLTRQTLFRDLNLLVVAGWIKRDSRGMYSSCKEEILSRRRSPVIGR